MVKTDSFTGSKPSTRIRVLVVDRNFMCSNLLAESLSRDPALEVNTVASPTEILRSPIRKADVALISLEFDAASKRGLEVARVLLASQPQTRIVILVDVSTRESVIASFRCGASGVFCRNQHPSELRNCIERVSRGEIWACGHESQYILEAIRDVPSCDGIDAGRFTLLSKRELQAAEQAAQGYTNKEIANKLKLSEYTVKNYLYRVFEKLGVSSRFELLFLLFNNRSQAAKFELVGLSQPVEAYLKAAEEGFVVAQYLLGLAHLEGSGVEKNSRSAYYWLRLAEENSEGLKQRIRVLTGELKSKMERGEMEALENNIASAVRQNLCMATRPPFGLMKSSGASSSFARTA